ncbi:hypothetical protein ACS0TY_011029 [Phlomoides rotata]
MLRQPELNPHFLPRHDNDDPVIEFPAPPPPHHRHVEPPHGPRPQRHLPHTKPSDPQLPTGGGGQHHHPPYLHGPTSRPTKPIAWLVAAFCALFWIIIIVGGLIILIVYLFFRPRSPRFDISTATINVAYLDMGYLLNADVTLLANFTNPNTKVKVDFSYVVLDLYYQNSVVATRYVEPFSVRKRESHFADVHMVSSQVRLPMEQSVALHRQIGEGRVRFEIRGIFRTRSKLGAIFHYSYWLYAHCEILLTPPPYGVLLRKKCVTKR